MKFLNVDLEITAPESLQPIVDHLGESVSVLYHDNHDEDEYLLVLELNPEPAEKAVETTIAALCTLIETLPEAAKYHWQNATTRIFDIGYEAERESERSIVDVSPAALVRIANLNATLRTTIYHESDDHESVAIAAPEA
jgi:hypothetical protein